MGDRIVVRVEGVSKKFCRRFKRSLWYGAQDIFADLALKPNSAKLRSEEFWAVEDVSFELKRGACLGLIGRNGAGKTTVLKMLSGLIKPDKGRIETHGRVGALIALGAGFSPVLTGRENVYVNGCVLGLSKREIDQKFDEIVDFAEIGEFIDAPVQSYSSGMNVRLGFAVARAVEPDILLLDEVLAVGDVNFQAKCFNTLAEFRKKGTAFIFVSHNNHMVSRYCDELIYLRNGRVAYAGDTGTGLSLYCDDMAVAPPENSSAVVEGHNVNGSGRIRFTSAQFVDSANRPVTCIDVGDQVSLVMQYRRDDLLVRSASMDVVVRDSEGILFQGTNISAGQPFDAFSDEGQLIVKFDHMPANSDHLDFYVALIDPQTAELYDWKRDLRLNVRRNISQHGRLLMQTEWSMGPEGADRSISGGEKA